MNRYRRRILEISRTVPALHIGGAFSCIEIVHTIYRELMAEGDTFILSKGHGAMAQYVVLEEMGVKPAMHAHPERGTPGISASTGSLGHGLGIAVGIAHADPAHNVYVVISDGELQEGSTWEAVMLARTLHVANLLIFVDCNGMGSLGRMPAALYPVAEKFKAFRLDAMDVDGHSVWSIKDSAGFLKKPGALICWTVKGKGVSFMENEPIWHYRSPNDEEYAKAMKELA